MRIEPAPLPQQSSLDYFGDETPQPDFMELLNSLMNESDTQDGIPEKTKSISPKNKVLYDKLSEVLKLSPSKIDEVKLLIMASFELEYEPDEPEHWVQLCLELPIFEKYIPTAKERIGSKFTDDDKLTRIIAKLSDMITANTGAN